MVSLADFYHWNDQQSLEQAILVARSHEIEFGEVEECSNAKGAMKKYELVQGTMLRLNTGGIVVKFVWCPHQDSNLELRFRNPVRLFLNILLLLCIFVLS